jgi:Dolichyl-phosphate-mannose-protein mannosyltransferase
MINLRPTAFHQRGINFERLYDLAVVAICLISFTFSWIETIVNIDSHHWGLMYVPALDIHRGAIPYKDTAIIYGWLTTWIQSVFIGIFGEKATSIGIPTGITYALTLQLSYRVFLRFLPRYFAFFSTFVMFLLHPYIVYAWSNYFSYTFLLGAILLLPNTYHVSRRTLLAGVMLGLSLLCRYSAAVAILPPFFLFFIYCWLTEKSRRSSVLTGGSIFALGFLLPIGAFLSYLLSQGVLIDFWCQNQAITAAWGRGIGLSDVLPRLLISILKPVVNLTGFHDTKIRFFSLNFIAILFTLRGVLFNKVKKQQPEQGNNIFMLVSLVSLFGYFNSVHIYEIFRLINASSLGIGLVAYSCHALVRKVAVAGQLNLAVQAWLKLPLIILLIVPCMVWPDTLILKRSSSASSPWLLERLAGTSNAVPTIKLFEGKRLSQEYYNFYAQIENKLATYTQDYILVNQTSDPLLMVLRDLPRIQKLAIPISPKFSDCCHETQAIEQIISAKRAIIFSLSDLALPGYQVIFKQVWPREIPGYGNILGIPIENNWLYVLAPKPDPNS